LLLAIVLLGASGGTLGQSAVPGLTTSSPCPPVDLAAESRRDAITDLVLEPTAPEAFAQALARARAAIPADDQRRPQEQLARDWPNLCRYKAANEALSGVERPRAVFMGDSITEGWVRADPSLFANGVLGRGIGGQTSPQMLVRFWQDVVALRPRVVHIMAGTNDIAGNTGPATVQDYRNNVLAMIDLAQVNGIAVVLAAVPPARRFSWREGLDPRPSIRDLNDWLRETAAARGLGYVDYGAVLADAAGGLRVDLGNDGVHPNREGYAAMRPLAERALAAAEKAPRE
jgi:lysophospholipase L1-like esterase